MIDENAVAEILTQAATLFKEKGEVPNLAELERKTKLTREKLRRWQREGYVWPLKETRGKKKGSVKLQGFTGVIDSMLKNDVTNGVVIMEKLVKVGYEGKLTIVRDYIRANSDALVPSERSLTVQDESKSRGMYYTTGPGECFQMDWGFVNVEDSEGNTWRCACFTMVCHHCGMRYIEFFPNAKQENLFIGMIHAFSVMGVPKYVLTDNMKSVVIGRDVLGNPVFNHDYDVFQKSFSFSTKLCKVAHPFTKGGVERLVRYVKENFIQGRTFINISDLNKQALEWCFYANSKVSKDRDCIPLEVHKGEGCQMLTNDMKALLVYLAPMRSIDFEGFVNYEGRKFGVPLSYTQKKARVMRKGEKLYVLNANTYETLTSFDVDWSKRPKTCIGQWAVPEENAQPEEHPTMPVTVVLRQTACQKPASRLARFSFCDDEGVNHANN